MRWRGKRLARGTLTFIAACVLAAVSVSVRAHSVVPGQGATAPLPYGTAGAILVQHFSGEHCVVNAEAVEIVVTTPLLQIQSKTPQPALDVIFSVSAIRHPQNGSEYTAVQVSWAATGATDTGGTDPDCNGSGVVLFNVDVTEAPKPTVANVAAPATTPTDPVSLWNGELFFEEKPELSLGGPMPLVLTRYYASRLRTTTGVSGPLGDNWSHSFLFTLTPPSGGVAKVIDNRGRVLRFQQSGGTFTLVSPTFAGYQLASTPNGYTLGDPIEDRFYNFNATGSLVSIQDRAGNMHTLTYASGRLTQVADGLGRVLSFAYGTNGRLASVSDGTRSVLYAYAGSNLASVTDVRGFTTQYAYDTVGALSGLMTRKTLPRGNVATAQVWGTDGNVASQADGLGNTVHFAYAEGSTVQTDPAGHTQTYRFDATGALTSLTDENGATSTYGYDAAGRRVRATDSLGQVTQTAFDAASGKLQSNTRADGSLTEYTYASQTQSGITFRVLAQASFPDGTAQTFSYDAKGNLTAFTDRAGKATTYTRNSRGQVLTMTNPAGGVTTFTYRSDGAVSSIRDAAGNTTTLGYDALRRANLITHADGTTRRHTLDAAGHLLTDTDERGQIARFTYDANGNLTSITDPLGNMTSIGYDALDRAVSVTDPLGATTSRSFDAIGRLASRTDRNGHTLVFGYDAASRLTSIGDPSGAVWSRTYDSEAFALSDIDPLGHTWLYDRDALGRFVRSHSPGNAATTVGYDNGSRVASLVDGAGVATEFTADQRGALAAIEQGGGLISTLIAKNDLGLVTGVTDGNGRVWQRSYDARGRTLSAIDPLGATATLNYDSLNRVSSVVFPGQLGSVQLTHDAAGNITRKLYTDGTDLRYTFDAAGRLLTASGLTLGYDGAGEIASSNGIAVARDAGGRITALTLAPGKTIGYAYDARDLLTNVTDWMGGVTTLGYDAASRLTSILRPNGVTTTFSYDADDRVTAITENGAQPLSSIAIQRDGRGKVVAETRNVPLQPSPVAAASAFSHDAASQIAAYTYDALGRRTRDAKRTYVWDLASRMSSYTDASGAVSFTYDAFGKRLSQTRSGVTQSYVWNYALGLPSVSIVRQGGSDLRYYVHAPGGPLLYSIEAAGAARRHYHYDDAGNTLFLTDDGGSITDAYAYTPYGVLLGSSGNTDNPFTFAGQTGAMRERADALYAMRSRVYDAESVHFLSRDPVRRSPAPAETNPYAYARANPLLYADPSGLSARINGDLSDTFAHTDFSVDVWKDGKIIGTLNASFGEGGYRGGGGYGGVLFRGLGTFNVTFEPGKCILGSAGPNALVVGGSREQDERVAQAILSSVDFASINVPQYQAGTPAADFLWARYKENRSESGELRSQLGFKTVKGSGDWTEYGVLWPERTCNTFTGTMLNVYFGENESTGVTAESVDLNLKAHLAKRPVVRPFPGTTFPGPGESGNIVIWMSHPQ